MVSPTVTTTYTLVAAGASGNATATATVTVGAVTAGLTYTNDVQPILAANCVTCHGPNSPAAGRNLSTYAGVLATLTAGSANSVLVTATQPGGSMYSFLSPTATQTQAQLSELIRQWVLTGAMQ